MINKKISSTLGIAIILTIAFFFGGLFWFLSNDQSIISDAVKYEKINIAIESKDEENGLKKYTFNKVDSFNKKSFEFFYPVNGNIVTNDIGGVKADKIIYNIGNKECGLVVLSGVGGIESSQDDNFSSRIEFIDVGEKQWRNLIWKSNNGYVYYGFNLVDDLSYNFNVDNRNLEQCLESYKKILSTFKFID